MQSTAVNTRRQLFIRGATTASAALLTAAACGQGREPGAGSLQQPALVTWAYWGALEQVAARETVMAAISQRHPTISFDKLHMPGNLTDYFAKIQVMVSSGNPLDLFMSSPIWVPNLVQRGLYQPLDQLMGKSRFPTRDYSAGTLDSFAFRGKQYALPEIVNFGIVLYNRGLFDRGGAKYPQDNWTWQQFLDLAKQLTRQGDVWGVHPVSTDLNNTLPWIWMNGGRIFDSEQDPKRSTMTMPATVDAIQWRADWAVKHRVAPLPGQVQGNPFFAGQLALNVSTITGFAQATKQIKDFAWDVVPLPRGKAGPVNFTGSAGQGLASGSKHVEAAWEALRYDMSPDGLREYVQVQWAAPPHLRLAAEDYMRLPPPPVNRKAVVDTIKHLRALPKSPNMLEMYYDIFGANLTATYKGEKTAKEACQQIETAVNALLQR